MGLTRNWAEIATGYPPVKSRDNPAYHGFAFWFLSEFINQNSEVLVILASFRRNKSPEGPALVKRL